MSLPSDPDKGGPPARTRVLLVEDHVDTATGLAWLLTRAGYEVTTVHAAAPALAAAEASPFQVVVSDIGLPDRNGYELMDEIHRRHGWPGIALTGYDEDEDRERARAAGFVASLVKPVNIDQLRSLLTTVCARGGTGHR